MYEVSALLLTSAVALSANLALVAIPVKGRYLAFFLVCISFSFA